VSLYLKVAVGASFYLLDAGRVLEIRSDDARGHWRGEGVPVVDCRDLFDEPAGMRGDGILFGEEDGAVAELIVDRVEGLVEIADAGLRPVPPIGPLGGLIDAVSALADERPMLWLRAEHMRATAAALG
jgi:chemotaxis signal transduction protein